MDCVPSVPELARELGFDAGSLPHMDWAELSRQAANMEVLRRLNIPGEDDLDDSDDDDVEPVL